MTASGEFPVLEVTGLKKHFPIGKGILQREAGRVRAVDGISFTIEKGKTFGLVGESGCGKSTAAKTIMHLHHPTGGTVRFEGEDVSEMAATDRARFRRRAQMIFQDPESSFDPRMTIGESVAEPLRVNGLRDRHRRREIVENLLVRVGLDATDADRYPHEFSGGQKQRIGLARALSVNPTLLVADEPVSALDVSIQAEILSLMAELQEEYDLAILLISHNLGVIRQVCDHVGVMYVGELVERGPTDAVFEDPRHPYTQALLSSIPNPDPHRPRERTPLSGDVPDPSDPPPACRFHTRCPKVIQPLDVSIDQDSWRHIMDLAVRLSDEEIDPEAIRTAVVTKADEHDEPASVDRSSFGRHVRAAFDIPTTVGSADVEQILASAIDALYERDVERAAERLETGLPSPCRTEAPPAIHVAPDHFATCHLVEPAGAQECTAPADEPAGD